MDVNILELWAPESEAEVVGAIAMWGNKAADELTMLRPEHFANHGNRAAFEAACAIRERGEEPDLTALENELLKMGKAELMPFETLVNYAQNTGSHRIGRKEKIIMERAAARKAVMMIAETANEIANNRGADAYALVEKLSRSLDGLQTTAVDDEATFDAAELMRIGLQEFEKRYTRGGAFTGLPTGIRSLDDKLFGLQNGGLYIVAGRPGMGKTAVGMSIAEHVADRCEGTVLVFNLEMSKEQLAMRSLAAVSDVSLSDIQAGSDGGGANFDKMSAAIATVKGRRMLVDVRSNISVAQIRAKARNVKNKQGLSLIVIDYLQLLDEPGAKFGGNTERVTWLSRQCKILAKELDVPVIVLSQVSRECEKRTDKRPILSDLRESGAIEQDADAVVFAYRHGYYTNDHTDDMLELIVAKQRMGETGTAYAAFRGQYGKIVDVGNAYVEAIRDKRAPKREGKKGRGL